MLSLTVMSQIPELLERTSKKQFLPGARDDVSPESSLSDCFRCSLARAMDKVRQRNFLRKKNALKIQFNLTVQPEENFRNTGFMFFLSFVLVGVDLSGFFVLDFISLATLAQQNAAVNQGKFNLYSCRLLAV